MTDVLDEPVALGPFTAYVGPGPQLRHLRWGADRCLDAIGLTVRDPEWGTVDPEPGRAVGSWRYRLGETWIDARFTFEATDDAVTVRSTLSTTTAVGVNRAGLVLLHPLELVGATFTALTDDGDVRGRFATEVDPRPVLTGVRRLAVELDDAVLGLDLGAHRYEIEDHRNWADAGWKSYTPPLADPAPFRLEPQRPLVHQIRISVTARPPTRRPAPRPEPAPDVLLGDVLLGDVLLGEDGVVLPRFGWGVGRGPEGPPAELGGDFLHAELVDGPDAGDRWRRARAQASAAGLPLRITLSCPAAALPDWRERLREPGLEAVAVVDPDSHVAEPELRAAARRLLPPGVALVGGTRGYLAELLRSRDGTEGADEVQLSLSAQVHHASDELIMDTTRAMPFVVRAARGAAGDRPLMIMPITSAQRGSVHRPAGERVAPWTADHPPDPRTGADFGAAWVLAAVAGLGGADALGFFSVEPGHGLVRADRTLTPAARLLAVLARHRGAPRVRVELADPRTLAALAVRTASGVQLWVAELIGLARTVSVLTPVGRRALRLPAYGVESLRLS